LSEIVAASEFCGRPEASWAALSEPAPMASFFFAQTPSTEKPA